MSHDDQQRAREGAFYRALPSKRITPLVVGTGAAKVDLSAIPTASGNVDLRGKWVILSSVLASRVMRGDHVSTLTSSTGLPLGAGTYEEFYIPEKGTQELTTIAAAATTLGILYSDA
jgi:hypothetical protein